MAASSSFGCRSAAEREIRQDRKRILVVDDNAAAAETLADILEYWGHQVRVAYDAAAALQAARADPPQVVILDLGMPEMDGWECARRLRALPALRNVVLLALTGFGGAEYEERSRQAGFDHHLTKPANLERLRGLVAGAER